MLRRVMGMLGRLTTSTHRANGSVVLETSLLVNYALAALRLRLANKCWIR